MTALRKFNRLGFLAAYIGVLGIVGAQREMVWANDVAQLETVYATDFIAASVGGLRNTENAGINVSGLSGTVNKAYLYWHGPMNSTNPLANAVIRVNNQTVTGVNIGYSDDNCWGYNNSQAYRADVTSLVRAERNGTYFLSQYVKQGTNINANGSSLLIFYNDSNAANNRDIVLFEGNDSNADNFYDALGWNVSLSGINYSAGRGYIQLHVSDGQIYEDDALVLNGEEIEHRGQVFQGTLVQAANNGPWGMGRLWDVVTYEVTGLLAAGSNTLALTHGYLGRDRQPKGDCVSLIVAAINLPAGAAPPPPPANSPPVVTGTPVVTVNSPAPLTVRADVIDGDGNPVTCTIAVNGVLVTTNSFFSESAPTTGTLSITNAFALGQHTVVFTAHDGVSSGSFTTVVNVIDNTPPVIAVENIVVPSDLGRTNAVVDYRGRLSVTDDFPGVTWIADRLPGTAFSIGGTTVTVTAVDASGNRTQRSFTITVTDSLPPVIQCPLDTLRPTDPGAINAIVRWTCSATDNLPGCTVTCAPSSGSAFAIGITTVVCSARDAAGNTANCMFTVMIVDREPPVLTVPANLVVATDPGQDIAVVNYTATLMDNVPGATVVCTPAPGSAFPLGTNMVSCIASDAAGNTLIRPFTIIVVDREPPVITVPANITVPNDPGLYSAVVSYAVSVSDNVPGATVVCAPASGSMFPVGTTAVVCTAVDDAGNRATNSFTVTVEDRESPVLTVPADFTRHVEPGQTGAAVTYTISATDNSGSATITCSVLSGARFGLGITLVRCTASDAARNSATRGFAVTVLEPSISDTQPPVITVPDNIVVPTDPGQNNAVVNYTVTVTDNQPGATVACLPPSGSAFAMGTSTVVCTASDVAGNRANNSFTVTVEDREKPVLTVPANLSIAAGPGQSNAVVTYTATATDNSGSVAVVCTPPSGTAFPVGVTIVTCTAIDDSGNVATGSFTVTVTRDAQPPDYGCIITSKPVLWPAHRKMVPVSVWMNFDRKNKVKFSSARIVSVTSNEPETGLDAEDTGPDWEITSAEKLKLKLRAERDPNGTGRVYTIVVEGKDSKGNLYLCQTTVTVPLECPKKKKK